MPPLVAILRRGPAWLAALLVALSAGLNAPAADDDPLPASVPVAGVTYTNYYFATNSHFTNGPWSIHVVRLDRLAADWQFRAVLATNSYYRLATLRELVEPFAPAAAINGDFYQRRWFAPGDPRGLMIQGGELVSAPEGLPAFWVDAKGGWRTEIVHSRLSVTWPNGYVEKLGLNEELRATRAALYTLANGSKSPEVNRRLKCELVLERAGRGPWLPLRPGQVYEARVRAIYEDGATPLGWDTMVLALSTNRLKTAPVPRQGMVLKISTHTSPDLAGAQVAIGGGPILIKDDWRKVRSKLPNVPNPRFNIKHIWERHPRSAIGWNRDYLYLVAVDGRQPWHSEGMKLTDLANFMKKTLRCENAMNLDGGGSATLWSDSQVRNSPADGEERPVANALMIFSGREVPDQPAH